MKRMTLAILGGFLVSGCAASHPAPSTQVALEQHHPIATPVIVLACDPGIRGPVRYLDRADREPAAFVGFEGLSTEYFDLSIEDNQVLDYYPNSFQRDASSERIGVIYR